MKKIILTVFLFSIFAFPARAGIGVSPPFIESNTICPGEQLEKEISFLRSDQAADYSLEIKFYKDKLGPDAQYLNGKSGEDDSLTMKQWIKPNEGKITIPKGVINLPVKFTIKVPDNIGPGNYKGKIWFIGTDTLSVAIEVSITVTNICNKKNDEQIEKINISNKNDLKTNITNRDIAIIVYERIIMFFKNIFSKLFNK